MSKKIITRICHRCISFSWAGYKEGGVCKKGHKPRFYDRTPRQILSGDKGWGYKRRCADYKSIDWYKEAMDECIPSKSECCDVIELLLDKAQTKNKG
jgi:hypothetical protein